MSNTKKLRYEVEQVSPERLMVIPAQAVRPNEAGASAAVPPGAGDPPAIPEGASEVLRATTAWRQLCARTGCAIRRDQFTTWLRTGRVASIRVGELYFVRVETLEELVEDAFNGAKW